MRISDWSSDVCSSDLVYFRVRADDGKINNNSVTYTAIGVDWIDMTPKGNDDALQQAELQNFANWYQYHRTRNKMAKAGASEAFGRLGENYRVGFDTIWNRGGGNANTSGSTPAYLIPVDSNDRSEERRVGKVSVSTCSTWGSPYHKKK